MATLARIRCPWSGFNGAPAVSTFYCLDPASFRPLLSPFWEAVTSQLPSTVIVGVEQSGDLINDVNGEITGSWTTGAPIGFPGDLVGSYSAPSGAVINWKTSSVVDGARLRGKTFIVPLGAGTYNTDGSVATGVLDVLRPAATALVDDSDANFVVWHRPRLASKPGVTPVVTQRDGSSAVVTLATVPDLAAVLRSRR